MNAKILSRIEKTLVAVLAMGFLLPLALTFTSWCVPRFAVIHPWIRNATLSGVQIIPPEVAPTSENVFAGTFQNALSNRYGAMFPGREMLIRSIGEIFLRLFRSSPGAIVVGPHGSLLEPAYLEEYFLLRPAPDELRPMAEDLRRLQDFCEARGLPFAVVITPNKAAIYPEDFPSGWARRNHPGPRYYDQFVSLLREKNIHYVDGHQIAANLKPTARVPLFPEGGGHWGDETALATTNAVLENLAQQGLPVAPIRQYESKVTNEPMGQDRDTAELLNTWRAPRYPVMQVTVQPTLPRVGSYRPNMAIIGGSFIWKMLQMIDVSAQFSELQFHFYYRRSMSLRRDGELHFLGEPPPPMSFDTDIFAADSLLLEINEQTLPEPKHLTAFLHDALAALPDPHAAKARFHYRGDIDYAWGTRLSFLAGGGMNMGATTGFATPGPDGSYSVGPKAGARFKATPPTSDIVLDVDSQPFVINDRVPTQTVQVFANDHPVGEWSWTTMGKGLHTLTIPRDFVSTGDVQLEFRVAHPISPAELGSNADTREFGFILRGMRLYPAG